MTLQQDQPEGQYSIRAEDLAVLSDLMAGLIRAGLPLDSSLRAVAQKWPGQAGTAMNQLAERLREGQSLDQVLSSISTSLPLAYVALVKAGQQTGRLADLLDDLTTLARLRQDSRRLAVISIIYPLLIALFSVLLGTYLLAYNIPALVAVMEDFRVEIPAWLLTMRQSGNWIRGLIPIEFWFGLALAGLFFVVWVTLKFGRLVEFYAEKIPVIGKAWRDARMAYWAQMMAILLDHQTPEHVAIELSAEATSDPVLTGRVSVLSDLIQSGQTPSLSDWTYAGIPALGAWALTWPGPAESRVSTLKLVASSYAASARHRMVFGASVFPLICLIVIGGFFVLVYGLLLFLPISSMYRSLS